MFMISKSCAVFSEVCSNWVNVTNAQGFTKDVRFIRCEGRVFYCQSRPFNGTDCFDGKIYVQRQILLKFYCKTLDKIFDGLDLSKNLLCCKWNIGMIRRQKTDVIFGLPKTQLNNRRRVLMKGKIGNMDTFSVFQILASNQSFQTRCLYLNYSMCQVKPATCWISRLKFFCAFGLEGNLESNQLKLLSFFLRSFICSP